MSFFHCPYSAENSEIYYQKFDLNCSQLVLRNARRSGMLRAKPGIELNFLLNLLSRTLIGCDNGPEWRAGELNDGTQAQQQSDWQVAQFGR